MNKISFIKHIFYGILSTKNLNVEQIKNSADYATKFSPMSMTAFS